MGFITNLLPSNLFHAICVVGDWLVKMAHFVSYNKEISREEVTKKNFLIIYIDRYHGLLDDIIFNRGPQFISKF